jgi:hypothetical protein
VRRICLTARTLDGVGSCQGRDKSWELRKFNNTLQQLRHGIRQVKIVSRVLSETIVRYGIECDKEEFIGLLGAIHIGLLYADQAKLVEAEAMYERALQG